jgi:amino acid adenylation domain-containing protein
LRELALRIGEARRGVPVEPIPVLPRAGDGTAALPLSYAQQRLWFLDQLEPGSAVYNIAYAVEIRGSLEPAVLASVLAAVVARHESLRTTFDAQEGAPVQVIAPPGPVRMPCVDLTALEPLARVAETARLCREEGARPFDLHRGPLLRGVLLRCAPEHHEFLLTLHHIIADGWSMGLMIGEINTLYRDSGSTALPPLPIQFADYAAWQQRTLAGEGFQRDLEYWRGQLAGASTLELPTDRPRPPVETFQGTIQPIRFEEALTAALHGVARQCGGTLYMVLMAAFHALLHQHSGQRDLSVGSPIANRDRVETEDLIGFFANTLVIRADLGGDPTFRELLGQLRTTILEAFAHQDMPFEKLVEALKPARDMSRNPLFQVMLAVQNVMRPEFDLPGMRWFPRDVDNGSSKFDLTFFLWEMDGRLVGKMEHASDLYDRATTRRLLERYQLLLAAVAADPELPLSRLPRMGAAERHQLLVEWNDTASSPSSAAVDCVHHWVEAQAASTPDAVAVLSGEVVLSYREVEARANRLARGLVRHGVGPEVRVGICTDRTWRTPVAMLAVLKAGGAAVALDPTYPRERLQTILKDAALRVLLTETPFADAFEFPDLTRLYLDREADLFPEEAPTPPPVTVYPDNPMYIIYTSGSTGVPKGITVTHRAFWNLLQWQLGDSPLVQRARTVQFATFGFCVSFQEIFSSFCAGGSLVMVPEGLRRDIEGLWQFLDHQGVERLHLPFAALKQLADVSALRADGDEAGAGSVGNRPVPSKLREVITAGEQLQIGRTVRRLFEHLGPQCTLHNQYGASETHVITSFTLPPFPAGASPDAWPDIAPVGRPVANTRIYLLDETLRPVPLGVPGEVFSSGDPNPRGYLNAPAQSAAKLLPDPFSGEVGARMYRTGDLARHLPDGRIEYMGRIDTQVKIRGFRVELGEVDTVLKLHPGVRDAVTVAQPGAAGTLRLVAYLVGQSAPAAEGGGAGEIDTGEVDAFLRTRLPEHMVPSAYVVLDALPLNANGKLDREALPVPELARPEGAVYVPPSTPTEEVLVALWADLLEVKQVGIRDDFFALGGHSLLATRVMARVRQELGVELPLRELFNHSTVEKLAERIDEATLTGAGAEDLEALLAAMEGANT